MAVAESIKPMIAAPPTQAGLSGHAAMNTTPFQSPFARLREAAHDCLRIMGVPPTVPPDEVALVFGGRSVTIPLFAEPELNPTERMIVDAIRAAGGPLQQKEIRAKTKICLRLIASTTPDMVRRGVLLKHPSQGFYLPGMAVAS